MMLHCKCTRNFTNSSNSKSLQDVHTYEQNEQLNKPDLVDGTLGITFNISLPSFTKIVNTRLLHIPSLKFNHMISIRQIYFGLSRQFHLNIVCIIALNTSAACGFAGHVIYSNLLVPFRVRESSLNFGYRSDATC